MAIVFDSDAGTITGISVGGLPDGVVDAGTLATNSVDSAELIDGAVDDSHMASISGRKNIIINGAMQVAQRGTSSTSDGYATVDRFFTYKESCEQLAVTQTQSTTSPDGFGSSYKLDVTTAESATEANDQYELVTRLEGQDLQQLQHGSSGAKSVTLSFWVRSSKTGTYCISLYKRDQGGTSRNITSTYAISSADTWEKKTVTFAGDTSQAIDNDNGRSLDIGWKLLIGSNFTGTASTTWDTQADARSANGHTATWGSSTSDDFYLTGVQLELGSTATDFEHRSYGEELALCQRYFEKLGNPDNSSGSVFFGITSATNATSARGPRIDFKVTKRATPTMALTGSLYYLSGPSWQSIAGFGANTQCIFPHQTTTSGVAGTAYTLATSSGSGNYITADAEL